MNEQQEQFDRIEREAEALRERLADSLSSCGPSEAAVERAKVAVRHELNEQWLREQGHPEPSEVAVADTRRAVRQTLAETGASHGAHRWWMNRWAWGVAAAAAIALAAGIFMFRDAASAPQYADRDANGNTTNPTVHAEDGQELVAEIEQYIALMESLPEGPTLTDEAQGEESLTDRMDTVQVELASLSDELTEDTEMVQTLHEIMNDIDELLKQETGVRQQGAGDAPREALG